MNKMWSALMLCTKTAAVSIICTCVNLLSFILFADDTNLFISGN